MVRHVITRATSAAGSPAKSPVLSQSSANTAGANASRYSRMICSLGMLGRLTTSASTAATPPTGLDITGLDITGLDITGLDITGVDSMGVAGAVGA